jgi:hypothetical protein
MPHACRIVVTTGPDRGKVFDVEEELAHIGRSPENHVVFDDPGMSEHHASILQREGRFAIYRQKSAEVQVDGGEIPSEKWVWLPTNSRLQFGRRTACQFSYEEIGQESGSVPTDDAAAGKSTSSSAAPVGDDGSVAETGTRKKAEKKTKRKRQVARFITDQGDLLVELGADGQLPELSLDDAATNRDRSAKSKESNPLLLYAVLALSFVMTLALLLLDAGSTSSKGLTKEQARRDIVQFYGREGDELRPFQRSLRAARLAHSRGDYRAERMEYRKVLNQLNSEDINQHLGVTGHHHTDEELRGLIGVLLTEDAAE